MQLATILFDRFPWLQAKGFISPALSNPDDNLDSNTPTGPLVLAMDCLVMESFTLSARPTRSLVETGELISDHVTLEPQKLSIEAIVTNTPVPLSAAFLTTNYKLLPTPVRAAFEILTGLYQDRLPFTFVGGLKVYKGMVLTSFNPVRNSKTGNVLHFTATMEQIRTVSTQLVPLLKLASKTSAATVSKGTQPAGAASLSSAAKVDATGNDLAASGWNPSTYGLNPSPMPAGGFQHI